jgi:hypothetical protein
MAKEAPMNSAILDTFIRLTGDSYRNTQGNTPRKNFKKGLAGTTTSSKVMVFKPA